MKIHLIAVGHKMPVWIQQGFEEYAKRMPPELRIELHEIKPEHRSSARSAESIMQVEAQRIDAALPASTQLVVLDERGKDLTTQQLAQQLEHWQQQGRDLTFVIGGADGIAPALKQRATLLLRLSSLTLPHGMVRVLLAEQLYRAVSILKHHPYHRE
ncbi:MAG: 23S rRNA (pseudouridine(1915)-N(3))-methyltransferase RlmH [Burkholderiaceae bacterium]|nr:MAG: 23S rRNA (pseudouridine(1915)-N(3))-methyltransferase RlmH [Burkholderiaceae bacterium]